MKAGIWYHIAVVADHNRRALYVDGVLQGQTDLGAVIERLHSPPDRGPIWLGASAGRRAVLQGLLDEISWYDRALDSDEARMLAQSRSRSPCPR